MIEDSRVYSYLCGYMPEFGTRSLANEQQPTKVFGEAAKYTDELLLREDTNGLKRFFHAIARLYGESSNIARMAIENVFLYHLGTSIESSQDRHAILKLVPERLRTIILKQCNAQGI